MYVPLDFPLLCTQWRNSCTEDPNISLPVTALWLSKDNIQEKSITLVSGQGSKKPPVLLVIYKLSLGRYDTALTSLSPSLFSVFKASSSFKKKTKPKERNPAV